MDLVTGALGKLPSKLLVLLRDEYKLQTGVKDQIRRLTRELESMHAALRKVAQVPPDQLDELGRLWARDVREASYDMEDIIDTFLVHVDGRSKEPADEAMFKSLMKKMGKLFSLSKSKARHEIASMIDVLSKQLEEVEKLRGRYTVDDIVHKPAATTSIDPRLLVLDTKASQLVGINEQRDKLIEMLTQGDHDMQETKIVSVVGIGGLGKTTLVKAVYDKLNLNSDCKAFVPVGQNPDLKNVLKDILIALDKKSYMKGFDFNIVDVKQLIDELQEFLKDKRYFIVIDDVWDIAAWRIIRKALDDNSLGSKIVITTRNHDVADEAGCSYKLKPLTHESSKILFYGRIFGSESECPSQFTEVSEKFLKKCGGVPLAIAITSSLLANKSGNIEVWNEVCDSIGSGLGSNHDMEIMRKILSLSYYDLPSYLRTCLLYLSVYPEDYEIEKDSLIWKWIAEGFVEKKRGSSLFQQGEEYFNQLINRSMIQAVESSYYMGVVRGCRVHDMVLDLIRDLSNKENFVTAISNDDEATSPHQNRVRRLAHQNRMMKQTQQDDHMDMAQVRSLVACRCDIYSWVLHPSYKLLRVLSLERCSVSWKCWQDLKHLGNLLHLRYLGLKQLYGNFSFKLPEEIGKLKLLQILDLGTSFEVPSGVCQLTQLVCLHGVFTTRAPDGSFLRKVTSLEELCIGIDKLDEESQWQFIKDVGNKSEVRVLEISLSLSHLKGMVQSDLVHSLGNLHKLQHLELRNYNGNVEAATREWDRVVLSRHLQHLCLDFILFRQLPSWISPVHMPILRYLWLDVDHMDESGLRNLGGLPELGFLRLSTPQSSMACTATVANITAVDGLFKKLRCCKLVGWMVRLVLNEDSTSVSFSIWNGMGAIVFGSKTKDEYSSSIAPPLVMPNLQELSYDVPVRACGDLGLECFPSLRDVEIIVNCEGASADDVGKAEAELRNAAQLHPNAPRIFLDRLNEHKMAQSIDQDNKESDDGDEEQQGRASATVTESGGDNPVTPSC